MSDLYLSIGGNLGDRLQMLTNCKMHIESRIGNIEKQSSVYESEAWGFSHPRDFYNQVLWVKTKLSASGVLKAISGIEADMGRQRSGNKTQAYEGRIIDVDILLYEEEIINRRDLIIPHPHMQDRNFVMIPMAEIAPELKHPRLGTNMRTLQELCPDDGKIRKLNNKSLNYEQR